MTTVSVLNQSSSDITRFFTGLFQMSGVNIKAWLSPGSCLTNYIKKISVCLKQIITENFFLATNLYQAFKSSSRCTAKANIYKKIHLGNMSSRCLQNVLKTYWSKHFSKNIRVNKTSVRRIQDVWIHINI